MDEKLPEIRVLEPIKLYLNSIHVVIEFAAHHSTVDSGPKD